MWIVILSWLVSVSFTVVIVLYRNQLPGGADWVDPIKFLGAAFAAWVGGIALFTVVGAAAAIVSLARPEQELFDARANPVSPPIGKAHRLRRESLARKARALFRPHIDQGGRCGI
ncbi:MAG TPA: hypothetical protein VG889_16525 [Rhizomicrobium sp.]|nr:hypothetical protein [Rhizomicrobium sp.]